MTSAIFQPLKFRNLEVKNRVFRSSISGRFDNYDGSGTDVRHRWDMKFARGGVGAIISSNTPVHPRGLIVPNYAHLDADDKIPFWRELGKGAREYGCKYLAQIAYSGRQRDIPGITYAKGLSSTDKSEPIHGLPCERATIPQIREIVECFAQAARRAREAELDGIEIHGCNGYLITQFLSPAINDREDEYGGSLENRARLPLEIMQAIRREVGDDYHVQFKITAVDHHDALFPWWGKGTTIEDSIQVCRWLEEAGVDGFHVSSGSSFPHPRNPAGAFPLADTIRSYDTMLSSGEKTFRNYLMFRTPPVNKVFKWAWERSAKSDGIEGINLGEARRVKAVRERPGDLRRRLPDPVDDRRRDRGRPRRRSLDGPAADRQSRPREPVRGRARPGAAPVHVLQQVPDQLHREPTRVLRAEPLRLARGDDSADPLGVRE